MPRPDWSPLGVWFKISDEHPHPFHMRSPRPPGPSICPPKFYITFVFHFRFFSLMCSSRLKRNWKQCLCKIFGGANKAHHGRCPRGVLPKRRLRLFWTTSILPGAIFKLTLSNYAAQDFNLYCSNSLMKIYPPFWTRKRGQGWFVKSWIKITQG